MTLGAGPRCSHRPSSRASRVTASAVREDSVGPDLSNAGVCLKPEEVVESILWPRRQVKEGYDGDHRRDRRRQDPPGLQSRRETSDTLVLRDPASGERFQVAKTKIEEMREDGTLMPDGLAAAMTPRRARDLVRFLLDLGRSDGVGRG